MPSHFRKEAHMKTDAVATLTMKKNLCAGREIDEKEYMCRVLKYDAKHEKLYLVLENAFLPELSLDAIYECNMRQEESVIMCTGRIRERYQNDHGKILKLEIKNGFYKINVKSVDK